MAKSPETPPKGTSEQPWVLRTPSGQSEFTAYRDAAADPPVLVVQVGKTELRYRLRRRAEAGGPRHRRSLGPLPQQSGPGLVWAEEGPARPLRQLRAAGHGGP